MFAYVHFAGAVLFALPLVLGQWQRVFVAELDGPRTRTLRLQVMGIV